MASAIPNTPPPQGTRRAVETALIEKCWKDPEFKAAVMSDPKGMFERHTGHTLPADVNIYIHEEDANTLHFSIPPAPPNMSELSDEELERVAGGSDILMTIGVTLALAFSFAASVGGSYALTSGGSTTASAPKSPW